MLSRESDILKTKRMMTSRWLMNKRFVFMLSVFLAFGAVYGNAEVADDYTRLLELIQLDDQQQPQNSIRPAIAQRNSILKNIPV
jgi:hypothetical protein